MMFTQHLFNKFHKISFPFWKPNCRIKHLVKLLFCYIVVFFTYSTWRMIFQGLKSSLISNDFPKNCNTKTSLISDTTHVLKRTHQKTTLILSFISSSLFIRVGVCKFIHVCELLITKSWWFILPILTSSRLGLPL